jgi:hypothetical protein
LWKDRVFAIRAKVQWLRRVPTHSDPNISGLNSKVKIWLPVLSKPSPEVSKKVCQTPVGQKLRKEIDFLEKVCFQTRAVP